MAIRVEQLPEAKLGAILEWVEATMSSFAGCRPAYRGHGDTAWTLRTTLHRRAEEIGQDPLVWEKTIVNEFVISAPSRCREFPSLDRLPEILVLMRHHGLPTRILDWTWSPLIAMFFATEPPHETDGAVWALETGKLNETFGWSGGIASLLAADKKVRSLVRSPFTNETPDIEVLACHAPESSSRLIAQRGFFTVHQTTLALEATSDAGQYLSKLVIPKEFKRVIRRQLDLLGITKAVLFPDLDALCEEIASRRRPQ